MRRNRSYGTCGEAKYRRHTRPNRSGNKIERWPDVSIWIELEQRFECAGWQQTRNDAIEQFGFIDRLSVEKKIFHSILYSNRLCQAAPECGNCALTVTECCGIVIFSFIVLFLKLSSKTQCFSSKTAATRVALGIQQWIVTWEPFRSDDERGSYK